MRSATRLVNGPSSVMGAERAKAATATMKGGVGELEGEPAEQHQIHPAGAVDAEAGEPEPAVGGFAKHLGEGVGGGRGGRWRSDATRVEIARTGGRVALDTAGSRRRLSSPLTPSKEAGQ